MPEPTLADLLEPAVRSPASQAVTPSHLGAAEKCAAVSIAISLKRIADSLDEVRTLLRPTYVTSIEPGGVRGFALHDNAHAAATPPADGPGSTT